MPDPPPASPPVSLQPSVALVTGAARRIGRAIALDLAAQGFDVAVHCNRSRHEAETVADRIRAAGRRAAVISADLTHARAVERVVAEAVERLGSLGLLVNNASVFEPDAADALSAAGWDRHIAVNLRAPLLLASRFAAHLPAEAEGVIINILDQRVWRLTPRFFSYGLSKAALWTATQTMAQAFAPRIRVAGIGPGATFASERQTEEDFAQLQQRLPLRRGPAIEEITAAIRFILAARSFTGQMIALDGGQHLAWETPDAIIPE
jgi:NAD(P)-dependent dehydrogenase (short-subunit alcohol dehydrogenase family)